MCIYLYIHTHNSTCIIYNSKNFTYLNPYLRICLLILERGRGRERERERNVHVREKQ